MTGESTNKGLGRRRFLKSIFGLGTAVQAVEAKGPVKPSKTFVWADLRTGQVGFPTGLSMASAPPGSLMKLVAAAALCEEGLINPNETQDCMGHVTLHHQQFNCQFAHGRVNLVEAIGKSCNVFFVKSAQRLSSQMFLKYAARFGLNSSVAGRASGAFPSEGTEPSFMYVLGLSANFVPTPLQILRMAAYIGNRGTVPLLHSAEEPPAPGQTEPVLTLSDGTWSRLSEGMELACRQGTCRKLDINNEKHIAAKTGTSVHGKKFQSWIAGFFPYEKPNYAFCLMAQSGTSQETAVPMAHEMLFSTTWP